MARPGNVPERPRSVPGASRDVPEAPKSILDRFWLDFPTIFDRFCCPSASFWTDFCSNLHPDGTVFLQFVCISFCVRGSHRRLRRCNEARRNDRKKPALRYLRPLPFRCDVQFSGALLQRPCHRRCHEIGGTKEGRAIHSEHLGTCVVWSFRLGARLSKTLRSTFLQCEHASAPSIYI